ncbi:hypothetical protein LguiA_030977 [Lonicera macranthoides]
MEEVNPVTTPPPSPKVLVPHRVSGPASEHLDNVGSRPWEFQVDPKASTNVFDLLVFSGPADSERINNGLAMIGFVAAMAVEASNKRR